MKKAKKSITPSLKNPLAKGSSNKRDIDSEDRYGAVTKSGNEISRIPMMAAGSKNIQRQHLKGRMTVWERIEFLSDTKPTVLFQNWGPNLDGASLVTALIQIENRDVAIYGHDFTVRAGSMDATNGRKLAKLFQLAGKTKFHR